MPIIEINIDGTVVETLVSRKDMPRTGETYRFPDGRVGLRVLSTPGRLASQWSDAAGTSTPYYQESLGTWVTSERQADAIAESKGLARMDDYGGKHAGMDAIERWQHAEAKRNADLDAYETQQAEARGDTDAD